MATSYPPWDVVATANPFCDLPWVRQGRMSFQAEILPKAHDEKNARRGYQLRAPPPSEPGGEQVGQLGTFLENTAYP